MSRRVVVILLAGVIAAAVAIPALADPGPTAQSASVKGLSKRALAKAKKALRQARVAKRRARRAASVAWDARDAAAAAQDSASAARGSASAATSLAGAAKGVADAAKISADASQAALAAMHPRSAVAAASQSTASEDFVALSGGPSVDVTVTSSALVQVWAQARVSDGGAVSLYEDGQPVRGQAECLGGESEVSGVLFASPGGSAEDPSGEATLTLATPATLPFCSSIGAPGPVLFESPPGPHTFELRYAAGCSCSGTATFSQRRLVVAPLP